MKSFKEKVLEVVKKIPSSKTLSYKAVARKAGNEKASRAVGMIMSKNKDKTIPCHRVIRSDGKLGGYNGLRAVSKESILKHEVSLSKKT